MSLRRNRSPFNRTPPGKVMLKTKLNRPLNVLNKSVNEQFCENQQMLHFAEKHIKCKHVDIGKKKINAALLA